MAGECVVRVAVQCAEAHADAVREAVGDALRYIPAVERVAVAVAVPGTIRDNVVDQGGAGALKGD